MNIDCQLTVENIANNNIAPVIPSCCTNQLYRFFNEDKFPIPKLIVDV